MIDCEQGHFSVARMERRQRKNPLILALISKRNVMNAVMLRDMRSRFFNHGLGFMLVPLWPLVHMGVIIAIHAAVIHNPPYGDSAPLFFATGLVPTLTFMYVSRFMGYSFVQNRAMLNFPAVKPLDVMLARGFLEVIGACITLTLIMTLLWIFGHNPWPINVERAVSAYLAIILLAFGCGAMIGVLSMFFPFILTIWQLSLIGIYISSGTMFVVSNLPDALSVPLSYSPVTESVEWMRTAFYESYSDKLVNPSYVISFGVTTLCLALLVERFFRRPMLEG
jgi:capsular polysaccharide transport system permease protein